MQWLTSDSDFTFEEVAELESSIEHEPGNAAMCYRLGLVYQRFYQTEKAHVAFKKAVHISPRKEEYVIALVNVLIKKKQLVPALNLLNSLPDTIHSVAFMLARLKVLAMLGFREKALILYRAVPADNPLKGRALRVVYRLLFMAGEYDECLAMCNAQLRVTPFETGALALKINALNEMGNIDKLESLLGIEGLVSRVDIEPSSSSSNLSDFNNAINTRLLKMVPFNDANTVVSGARLEQVDYSEASEIKHLKLQIQSSVSAHAAGIHAGGSWFAKSVPPVVKLYSWGTLSNKSGYRVPHYHSGGWLSGVYYSRVPEDMGKNHAGCLEIGCMPDYCTNKKLPNFERIKPLEGQLVIFPSFLYHAVVPQRNAGLRIGIAFDVQPVESAKE